MNTSQERYKREIPSFSSSLLDAIYRSIDESSAIETKTKRRKNFILEDGESLRRAIMVEKWMDTENRTHISSKSRPYKAFSSSASSCGDTFSSFEPEGPKLRNLGIQEEEKLCLEMKSTKSKATKIYSGLKKVKQPISPGRRLTNFLNSLFSSKNGKSKQDLSSSLQKSRSVKDATTFTRSCLSKQPSRTNSKRSVRFYPVAVNMKDDDSRSCGLTYEYDRVRTKQVENNTYLNELKYKTACLDEDGNDDDMSCSSSDLFELKNLGAIGVSRTKYTEELPVYGTTSLKTK